MSGPWEKYGAQPQQAAPPQGPWLKYQGQPSAAPAAPVEQPAAVPAPAPGQPQTNIVRQTSSGLNEGIANALGLPVDTVTSVLNMGLRAVGAGEIKAPVGGSDSIKGWMGDTLIDPTAPQTGPQRFARRTGQEVGAGAVMAPVAGLASAGELALNTAANVGAGLGSSVANEVAPGNATADLVGGLLGGGAVLAGAHALRPGPEAPSNAELRSTQNAAYDVVRNDPAKLSPADTVSLKNDILQGLSDAKISPTRHPKAYSMAEDLMRRPNPTLNDIDQWRQEVSRDVMGSGDPAERFMGQIIKDKIDQFTANLGPGSADPATLDALSVGRDATQRVKKSEMLDTATTKAQRRAASTGTGGNVINASRQNIRAILDDPKKVRGFSAGERQQMEDIVRGTAGTNAARLVGRLAPTSGAFPFTGALIGSGLTGGTGNPIYAAPAIIGEIAKRWGEHLTDKQIEKLSAIIRNGGPIPSKGLTVSEFRVLQGATAALAANQSPAEQPQ